MTDRRQCNPTTNGRHLVVGWPNADWAGVEALLQAGRLPNMAQLNAKGCAVRVSAPPPACHAAAWTTLATGLLADRHGVLASSEIRPDRSGVQPSGQRSWRAPAFWELLEAADKRTVCVAWPATFPALRWPGSHVDERFAVATGSDFESWAMLPDVVAPPSLRTALRELRIHPADGLRGQVEALLPETVNADPRNDQRPLLLQAALARVGTVHAVATFLAEGEWDLLCICYDLLRQVIGGAMPGDAGADALYARLILRVYGLHDMMLGRLMELAGPDTTVIVVGDGTRDDQGLSRDGFLIARGPGIVASPGASHSLADLAPSLLARFGLRHPCDGRPIGALVPVVPTAITLNVRPNVVAGRASSGPALTPEIPPNLEPAQVNALRHCIAERLTSLADVQMARGRVAEASETLESLRRQEGNSISVLQRLVQCRALLHDAAGCLPLAQDLISLAPGNPWGHLAMAACSVLRCDDDAAQPHIDRATRLAGGDITVALRLGGLELLRGRHELAASRFRSILARSPDLPEALHGLGVALASTGDPNGAEQALRSSIARQNAQPLVHLQLAEVLVGKADFHGGLAILERLRERHPGLTDIDVMITRAQRELARQLASAAIVAARVITETQP